MLWRGPQLEEDVVLRVCWEWEGWACFGSMGGMTWTCSRGEWGAREGSRGMV